MAQRNASEAVDDNQSLIEQVLRAHVESCRLPGEPEEVSRARAELVLQMLIARTPGEVAAAHRAAVRWLGEHPDDRVVSETGEQLLMVMHALELDETAMS